MSVSRVETIFRIDNFSHVFLKLVCVGADVNVLHYLTDLL